jgi:hypothetical protein
VSYTRRQQFHRRTHRGHRRGQHQAVRRRCQRRRSADHLCRSARRVARLGTLSIGDAGVLDLQDWTRARRLAALRSGTSEAGSAVGFDADSSEELAFGFVSVTIVADDVNTRKTKRCIANSAQAGIDVRQGTPIVISLEGRAVGGGDLSTGELKREMATRGSFELDGASCQYKFAAPVTRPGTGQYTVDIGEARIAFSRDDLRKGIDLELS